MSSQQPTAAFCRRRQFEWCLVCLTGALLVFNVLDWFDLIPYQGFQPGRMVFLSAALLLQPVAALVRDRSLPASYALLVSSLALLVASFTSAS